MAEVTPEATTTTPTESAAIEDTTTAAPPAAPAMVSDPEPTAPNTPTPTTPEPATTKTVTSKTVTYRTPAGNDNQIAVTITLNNDTVSDVSVNYNNGRGVHNNHQKRFDGEFRAQVIGKTIDNISLSRVGGASLTSKAFNDALASVPR